MSKPALGIDLGTSSVKVCLLDENGKIVETHVTGYPTYSSSPIWMEQDPSDWLESVVIAINELSSKHQDLVSRLGSICLTSAAHIGVLLDEQNQVIRNALLWSDQRSTAQVEYLLVDEQQIFTISANRPSTSWTLAHFLWVKESEPELWARVKRVCLSKDYLLHYLTGCWVTDPATAVSSMLYDRNTGQWSLHLLSYLGLDPSQLPIVKDSCERVGTLLPCIASRLGLPQEAVVVNGSLDSAMESYGSGARKPGDIVIRIGTAGGIHKVSQQPSPIRSLLSYPFLINGLWYSQAGTNAAGSAIRWATKLLQFEPQDAGFDLFDALAEHVPVGSEDLFFHPYLNGERTPYWNAKLKGSYIGLSFLHTQAHMARAVLEGVCYSLKDALLTMMSPKELPQTVVVVGGGAKDLLLIKILSSVLQTSLQCMSTLDSSYGCARIGQLALYDPSSLDMLDSIESSCIHPVDEWVELYEKGFEKYKKISDALQAIYT